MLECLNAQGPGLRKEYLSATWGEFPPPASAGKEMRTRVHEKKPMPDRKGVVNPTNAGHTPCRPPGTRSRRRLPGLRGPRRRSRRSPRPPTTLTRPTVGTLRGCGRCSVATLTRAHMAPGDRACHCHKDCEQGRWERYGIHRPFRSSHIGCYFWPSLLLFLLSSPIRHAWHGGRQRCASSAWEFLGRVTG